MIGLIVRRMLISMLLGIVAGVGINELTFPFVKSEAERAPQRVELVIPAGTAEKVARGESIPALPDNMIFVLGDTLVVKNEDVVNHYFGPLFIPPGASASLTLSQADNLAITCSFEPTKYLGLDVREAVTVSTRLYAIFIAGIPLGFLFALYGFLVWPLKPKAQETE
jgi:hypothetical protein